MKLHDSGLFISATDLSNHLACRHLTELDRALAEGRLDPPERFDPKLAVLRQRGLEHERRYLEQLRAEGLRIVELEEGESEEGSVASAREAMREGADVIYQATLVGGRWRGRADVLRRIERASDLGSWSYEVVDTKLARETRAGTLLQLCLYSDLLEAVQGVRPKLMYVIVPGQELVTQRYRVDDFLAYYRLVKRRLEESLEGGPEASDSYPLPVPHCDVCRWWARCVRRRHEDDHLCLVAGMGRLHQRELNRWEIGTLRELSDLPLPLDRRPERGSVDVYEKLREQARVQREARERNEPVYELLPAEEGQGLARLPEPTPADVFFDIEGDPFYDEGGLEFLLGTVTSGPDGEPEYRCLWAPDREEERAAFERWIDDVMALWEREPGLHVYHFGHYEMSAIKRLMGRYGTRGDEVDRLLRGRRFVDLHTAVRQGVRAGVERYTLKELEALYDFERALPLREASSTLRAVESALELRRREDLGEELRAGVEAYNRDDCLSTLRLRDWLEDRRRDLVASGRPVPRPPAESGEPSDKVKERSERVEQLAARLLEGVPADAGARGAEDEARWLLAHSLDWHWREDKATWWEFFRLADLTDEERLEEPKALAGLQRIAGFLSEQGGTDACPVDRYRFPPQEVQLDPGDELYVDADLQHKIGGIRDLDLSRCTVDIKKTGACRDEHPSSVFAHRYVRTRVLEDSLDRLGRAVADNGLDASHEPSAARKLLLGRPPAALGSGEIPSAEGSVAHARRLALSLDHDVLPIQGPPGSGKTYTAARMIVELVKAGKKVGVTAVSHKVIRHLLEKAVEAGQEEGVEVRCVHKVGNDEHGEHPAIVDTKNKKEPARCLAAEEVEVAGGTVWLWSAENYTGAVDALFVDEAGQMSLANALAAAQAAESLVLVGDPQQLEQPMQGVHPEGTDVSALEHLLAGEETLPRDRGLFLEETRRLHPRLCAFTSEQFYDGRLASLEGLQRQELRAPEPFSSSGLYVVPVEHEGNQNASTEEVEAIERLVRGWLAADASWVDQEGNEALLTWSDVLIVAPYNAQVSALYERLPEARIGTVDKFQGQEAPVVIYSMTTSSPEEAPRGMEFLYSRHRLNVATSRARCAAILVASPRLFEPECRTPRQMRLANALCRFREMAAVVGSRDLSG